MILKLFSIYDSKAENFNQPFAMSAAGQAIRWFEELSQDTNSTISRFPNDFVLYEIGTFDNSTGNIVNLDPKINLGLATQFQKPKNMPLFQEQKGNA